NHSFELGPVAHAPPLRVIAILLATARVAARRLKMAARVCADPHVFVSRRNSEGLEARQCVAIGYFGAVGPHVSEAVAAAPAPNAGLAIAHVNETGSLRNFCRF